MPDDPRSLRRLGGGRWQTRRALHHRVLLWALARGRRGDDRRAGSVARARTVRVACRRARCHRGDPCGACGDVAAGRPAAGGTRSPAAPGRREQVPAPPRTATTKVRPPEPGKPEEPEEPDWIADLPPRKRGRARSFSTLSRTVAWPTRPKSSAPISWMVGRPSQGHCSASGWRDRSRRRSKRDEDASTPSARLISPTRSWKLPPVLSRPGTCRAGGSSSSRPAGAGRPIEPHDR